MHKGFRILDTLEFECKLVLDDSISKVLIHLPLLSCTSFGI